MARLITTVSVGLVAVIGAAACVQPPPVPPPPPQQRTDYRCSNGESLQVRFFPLQGVAVLVRDGKTRELQQQPAASGFLYTDDPLTVRGKGAALSIESAGAATLDCTAVRP